MKEIVWIAFFIVGAITFCVGNCSEPEPKLQRAIESQGMTNVIVGAWDPWECSGGDTISRTFSATNSAGQRVRGTICCGYFFKGCTVRW